MDRDISFVSHGEDARTSSKRCLDSAQNDKALDMTEKLFPALDVYHDTMPHSAAMNMAIDEALLECAKIPSIRFYRWDHAALSFGYFGRFAEVANYAARRDLVRRWTGGGIVLHEDDLTYSIVITANHPVFAKSSMSIYAAVHKAIRDALAANGQRAELATVAALYERQNETDSAVADRRYSTLREGNTGACFSNPVRADVMLSGRKIAGGAQRRTRVGLLHQGSIQHVDLGNGLAERFAKELARQWIERKLDETILNRAFEIAVQKYETAAWLRRR